MTAIESDDHHASHRHLLWHLDAPVSAARIDAIVVPTARPAPYLRHAVSLARDLACPLLTLCSGRWSSAAETVRCALPGDEIITVDFPGAHALRLPRFGTTQVPPRWLRRKTDTAAKRNFALALARIIGWERIVFLDDDITVGAPDDLRRAAGLLGQYDTVGLSVGGFPDNSVVCHAYRAVGGPQESFVGGGALAVRISAAGSFFPDIYNEDWFYLLEEKGLRRLAVTGKVIQHPYDPYRTPDRARSEEFGDVLAEGIFWLLDEGKTLDHAADPRHWELFLARRRRFIDHVLGLIPGLDEKADEKRRMAEALRAAKGRLALIEPGLCVAYLEAWREDTRVWRRYLNRLPQLDDVEKALSELARGPVTVMGPHS